MANVVEVRVQASGTSALSAEFRKASGEVRQFSGDLDRVAKTQLAQTEGAFRALGLEGSGAFRKMRQSFQEAKLTEAMDTLRKSSFATAEEVKRAGDIYAQKLAAIRNGTTAAVTGVGQFSNAVTSANNALSQAGVNTGVFGQAVGALASPASLAAVALGTVAAAALAGVRALSANADEVKKLTAVSGLSAEAADNLADTFQLLGKDTTALNMALFKMASEIDSGGKALAKIGVSATDSSGALKMEGELFLEVRDRLSDMTSATERNAAAQAIFGRGARELADVFALTREEFRAVSEQAGGYSEWNDKLQRQAIDYQRSMAALALQFDAVAQKIGRVVIPVLTDLLKYISDIVAASKNPIDFIIRFTFGNATGGAISNAAADVKAWLKPYDDAVRAWAADMLAGTNLGKVLSASVTAGMAQAGAAFDDDRPTIRAPRPPAGTSDADIAQYKKAAAALDTFRDKLVALSVADATAKQLMGVREEVAKLSKEAPQLAPQFAAIGAAMEAVIVQGAKLKEAEASQAEAWKETGAIVSEMDTGLMELARPLALSADLATKFALAGDDVTFSLGAGTRAVITFGAAFRTMAQPAEEAVEILEQFGPHLDAAGRAALDYQSAMAEAGIRSRVLGDDFDVVGARLAALQGQFADLIRSSHGELTPEIEAVGAALRRELADQRIYQTIEGGLLSITDTITKMTDAWIQGTLTWKSAGETLLGFLLNFAQTILHDVFDPILKGLARVASSWISSFLFGGGGTSAASGIGGLIGSFGSGGGGASWVEGSTGLLELAGGASGGGSGDIGSMLSSVASLVSGAYNYIAAPLLELPTLTQVAGQGLSYVGTALGLIGPSAAASAAAIASMSGGVVGLTGAVGAFGPIAAASLEAVAAGSAFAAAGAAGAGAAAGAGTGAATGAAVAGGASLAGGLATAGATLPAVLLSIGIMLQAQSKADFYWREREKARQAQAMTQGVMGGLEGLTLQNAVEGMRRTFLETLGGFAMYSAITPRDLEAKRQAGLLAPQDIPSSYVGEGGGYRVDTGAAESSLQDFQAMFEYTQSSVLKSAESLVASLGKLGIEATTIWATIGKNAPLGKLFEDVNLWNNLVVAYASTLEGLLGTGSVPAATEALATLRAEATLTALSLDTIAEVLGVTRQAIPDFTSMLAEDIPVAIQAMKDSLIDAFMAEPVKIAGLLDFGSLQKDGEDVQNTIARMVTALAGLGAMMTNLADEAAALRGDLDVPAQFAKALGEIADAMAAAQHTLATTQDPEQMLASAQELEALIRERYRIEIETVTALIAQYREYASAVTASQSALAAASGTLDQLGVSFAGWTDTTAEFVRGLDDALAQLAALPALMAQALAEAGQIARAAGSLDAGLDVLLAGPVDALRDTFDEVMEILDPSQRASALQGFLAQIDSFFQQATAGIRAYYAEAAETARGLAAAVIQGIRDAAAVQTAPLETQRAGFQAELAVSQEQQKALQATIAGIREVLRVRVAALNEERKAILAPLAIMREQAQASLEALSELRDATQEQISAIREALRVRVDALNEERDGLQDILRVAQEAARIAKGLRDTLTRLEVGDLAPPNAQAQFAAAMQAFERATPEEASAAGQQVLRTAIDTGLMTLPSPEYQVLFRRITEHLAHLAEQAEAQASPAEASLARLESIDAEIKALNATAEAALAPLEATLKSIDVEAKGLSLSLKSIDARIADVNTSFDAAIKSLTDQAEVDLAPLEVALGTLEAQSTQLSKSIDDLSKSIDDINKAADVDVEAVNTKLQEHLTTLSGQEQDAIDRVKDALAPLAADTVRAIVDVTAHLRETIANLRAQYFAITAGVGHEAWIAARTHAAATALEGLGASIENSLRTLVSGRLDALVGLGGPTDVKAALDNSRVAYNTSGTMFNTAMTASILAGALKWQPGDLRYYESGTPFVPQTGPAMLHQGERVLTAAENRTYTAAAVGERRGATVTFAPGSIVVSGVQDPVAIVDRIQGELARRFRRGGELTSSVQGR